MEYKTTKELEEKYKLLRYEGRYQEKAKVDHAILEHELETKNSLDYLLPEWICILKRYFSKAYGPRKPFCRELKEKDL